MGEWFSSRSVGGFVYSLTLTSNRLLTSIVSRRFPLIMRRIGIRITIIRARPGIILVLVREILRLDDALCL